MTATTVPPILHSPPRPTAAGPDRTETDRPPQHLASHLLAAARPTQWIKNASVLVVPGVVLASIGLGGLARALVAAGAFCAASSSVYLLNDTLDRDHDRLHPVKRHRPIASGLVRPFEALATAALLALVALLIAWTVAPGAGLMVTAYLVTTAAYSAWLKRIAYVDVAVLAGGFLLRVLGGAAAVGAPAPALLLAAVFSGAAFLAFGKRRAEVTLLGDGAAAHRVSLSRYRAMDLDHAIVGTVVATVLTFGLWVRATVPGGLGTVLGLLAAGGLASALDAQRRSLRTGGGGNPTHDLTSNHALLPGLALAAFVVLTAGVIR